MTRNTRGVRRTHPRRRDPDARSAAPASNPPSPTPPPMPTTEFDIDAVCRALADPTRRALLDLLRDGPKTTGDLCLAFPAVTRFAVMKHLGILESAQLVLATREGSKRWNWLNGAPLATLMQRWMTPLAISWSSDMLAFAQIAAEKIKR
ncbi:MAG: ArsR/SmtB family transcription factor [Phycisphaerales bacterium]